MKAFRHAALFLLVLLAIPALGASRQTISYVVKAGDTGSAICAKYGLSYGAFAKLNPGVNIEGLQAGVRVNVPAAATTAQTKKAVDKKAAAAEVSVEPSVAPAANKAKEVDAGNAVSPLVKPDDAQAKEPAKAPVKPKAKPQAKPAGYLSKYYDSSTKSAKQGEPSVLASLLRVAGALVFVVALLWVSLYAYKQFTSGKTIRKSPKRSINVIETAGLGPNRALHVVQAGDKYFLIGSTPTQVNLVAELNSATSEAADPVKAEDFASMLQRSSSSTDRAETATKVGDALRDGAMFLQKRTSATRSMRAKAESDEV